MSVLVTAPGLYPGLDEDRYHADDSLAPELGRSLSATGAKLLLRSPALYAWQRDHGRPDKREFDIGHAAHRFILGAGNEITAVDADNWRTKAARKAAADARALGLVPLLREDFEAASRMAQAVEEHPTFRRLLDDGQPEVSAYWVDEETGVTCRARADWLHPRAVVDVKTAVDASPAGFASSAAKWRYDMQAAAYGEAFGTHLPFVFVVVEKEPPHLCAAYVLPDDALAIGADDWHRAIRRYAACESSGEWPGYSAEIETLRMPRYYYAAQSA